MNPSFNSNNYTTIICGAGAVKNGWVPVQKALKKLLGYEVNADQVNFFFSLLVYQLRWFCSIDSKEAKKSAKQLIMILDNVRTKIANELRDHQKNNLINVRKEFVEILEKYFGDSTDPFLYITTNWDTTCELKIREYFSSRHLDKILRLYPLYLHGSINSTSTIYFPTEMTKEPYRSKEEEKKIGTIHGSIMRGLETSTRSIVYGLSLSQLDAELCMTLASGWDCDVLQEIIVINPDHELVANRVLMLLNDKKQVRVVGLHPNNLNTEIVYWDT